MLPRARRAIRRTEQCLSLAVEQRLRGCACVEVGWIGYIQLRMGLILDLPLVSHYYLFRHMALIINLHAMAVTDDESSFDEPRLEPRYMSRKSLRLGKGV
jgi:hypothetical protein